MKVGDLVKWQTSAWVFKDAEKNYANPGIIVEVDDSHRQCRYNILWADGRVTTEFSGYLDTYKT